MSNHQRIIDSIHHVLTTDSAIDPNDLAALAHQYAEAVKDANRRIQTCVERLRGGFLQEAIDECEREPNLLDMVGTLDFLERDAWNDVLRQYSLPVPTDLQVALAEELNEAYTVEQQLARLMRLNRLHALARSPLPPRIEVLRKLAELDPKTSAWRGDLRDYEQLRLNQLGDEADQAIRRRSIVALAALEKEVRSPAWQQAPATALVNRVIEAHTRLRGEGAHQQLVGLEQELTAAFSELNVERGRTARAQWNARAAIGISDPQDPLLEQAAPALQWLDKEDHRERTEAQHQAMLVKLQQALDKDSPRTELERLANGVLQFGQGLPIVVQQRLNERLRLLDLQTKRRHVFVLILGVLVVLGTAGLTGAYLVHQMRAGEVTAHADSLEKLIADGKLSEAQRYLQELEAQAPRVYHSAPLQKLQGDLQAALAVESGRKAKLAEHIAAARSSGINNPEWESFVKAVEELQQAEKMTRFDSERAEIKEVYRLIAEKRRQMQAEIDDRFSKELEAFRKQLAAADRDDGDALRKLSDTVKELQAQSRVSAGLMEALNPLATRLKGMMSDSATQRREADLLDRVTSSVGTYATYLSALEAYAKVFPDAARSADFTRVASQEAEFCKALDRWNQVVQQWTGRDLHTLSPVQAAELAESATKTLEDPKLGGLPGADALKQAVPFLKATAQRIDGNSREPIQARLNEPLNNDAVKSLLMAETADGARYYFRAEPALIGGSWSIWYFTGLDLTKRRNVKIPEADIRNPPGANGPDWTSPQAAFSRTARDGLQGLSDANWESTFVKTLIAIHGDRRMEPLVKLQLMQFFLDVACQGSHCLAKAFQPDLDLLKSAALDGSANYIDPEDPQGKEAREAARRILDKVRAPGTVAIEAAEYANAMRSPSLGPRYRWVGWLHRIQTGAWACSAPGPLCGGKTAELLVVLPAAGDGPVQLRKVGTCQQGKFTPDPSAGGAMLEGRPVFAADQ